MGALEGRLAKTRDAARRKRRQRIVSDFEHLSDEQLAQVWKDHATSTARRLRRAAKEVRGDTRTKRLENVLTGAMLEVARQRPKDFWWSGRLRHRKACEYVAAHLPAAAKRLLKKGSRVPWTTVRNYTAAIAGLRWQDDVARRTRETAARSGFFADATRH